MTSIQLYIQYEDTISAARKSAFTVLEEKGMNYCLENVDALTKEATANFEKEKQPTDKTMIELYRQRFEACLKEG